MVNESGLQCTVAWHEETLSFIQRCVACKIAKSVVFSNK